MEKQLSSGCRPTIRLSFATTLLGLHGFVAMETHEQKCPLRASPLTDAGHTLQDG